MDLIERLRDGLSHQEGQPCTCATDDASCPYCNASERIHEDMARAAAIVEAAKFVFSGLEERMKTAAAAGAPVPVFWGISNLSESLRRAGLISD